MFIISRNMPINVLKRILNAFSVSYFPLMYHYFNDLLSFADVTLNILLLCPMAAE